MSTSSLSSGRVIKAEANYYSVEWHEQIYLCTLRGNLKKAGDTIKVGDQVVIEGLDHERPAITVLLPRRNELQKPAIANIDRVLVVMSCQQPDFNPILVDRLLLSILFEGIQPILCISKSDLLDSDDKIWLSAEYTGFPVFFLSAKTGEGISEILTELSGQVAVLAGASGVGKSSLINRLNPECELVIGEVNQKMGTGKHTTRHVSLHRIETGQKSGWIADSPGFSACEIPPLKRAELATYYPEFQPLLGHCGFKDCLHRDEEACAIKNAFEEHSMRYYNYLRLLEEVETKFRHRHYESSSKEEGLTKTAIGKNQQNRVLKLGTVGRARNRRTQKQGYEQLNQWTDVDLEYLENLEDANEWRI